MWSGDIASNLESLATHMNAQMHMSLSGIDYYGADIGGFRREVMPWNDKAGAYRGYEDELYTQWFANGAWFDVPVRPHTDNEFVRVSPPYATAPHLVGHVPSNLANIRQQDDPAVRRIGHEKLIGRDLLVGIVPRHGEHARDVYLPAGRWADFYGNTWVVSAGETLRDVPVYRGGLFRLPAFVRAGAILPMMPVDAATRDAFGHRGDGAGPDPLVLRVYADAGASSFTLYEDDGATLAYDAGGRPRYPHRTTRIHQRAEVGSARVTVDPAVDAGGAGPFEGAVVERPVVVELVVDGAEATTVSLNGAPLPELATAEAFGSAASGWTNAGRNLVWAKSPSSDVHGTVTFTFGLRAIAPTATVAFACDRGFTAPDTAVYIAGSLPALGGWDPARAVRLDPSIYWDCIVSPPPGHNGPGPRRAGWAGRGDPPPRRLRGRAGAGAARAPARAGAGGPVLRGEGGLRGGGRLRAAAGGEVAGGGGAGLVPAAAGRAAPRAARAAAAAAARRRSGVRPGAGMAGSGLALVNAPYGAEAAARRQAAPAPR